MLINPFWFTQNSAQAASDLRVGVSPPIEEKLVIMEVQPHSNIIQQVFLELIAELLCLRAGVTLFYVVGRFSPNIIEIKLI